MDNLPKVNVPPREGRAPTAPGGPTWACVVCKRANGAEAAKCAVCGTRKDYDGRASKSRPGSAQPAKQRPVPATDGDGRSGDGRAGESRRPAPKKVRKRPSGAPAGDDDDDLDDYGGGTWNFGDQDLPKCASPKAADSDFDEDDAGFTTAPKRTTFWLNTAVTQLHNIRQEPIKGSPIVGHLLADTEIAVVAEAGNWIKVKRHMKPNKSSSTNAYGDDGSDEGWCIRRDGGQVFVVEDGDAYPNRAGDEEELIYELRDEDHHRYYFNNITGVSMWDPPEWVDDVDPASGAVYYVHAQTGETQWERPFDFVPIVREEVYSTPQAAFIKSILSPKRSLRNLNVPGK